MEELAMSESIWNRDEDQSLGKPQIVTAEPTRVALAVTTNAIPMEIEAEMIAILERPRGRESADVAFRKKEAELIATLDRLTADESRNLYKRLGRRVVAGDRLSELFGGLIAERRARLLAFVADARRREVLRANRAPRAA
jgi:hypothetical protein